MLVERPFSQRLASKGKIFSTPERETNGTSQQPIRAGAAIN